MSLIGHGSLSQTHTCIVVHTPVTLTLREKRWASAVRGCVPDPPAPSLPPPVPSGGSSFTKGPLKPQKNATALCELLNPLKSNHAPAHSRLHSRPHIPFTVSLLTPRPQLEQEWEGRSAQLWVQVMMGQVGWEVDEQENEETFDIVPFPF